MNREPALGLIPSARSAKARRFRSEAVANSAPATPRAENAG